MTENTSPNLPHQFQKGQSGNPAGKPKGARHKTTLLAERLMKDDAEKIVNAVVAAAINGDMTAAKIILDRIAPVRRSHSFDLPKIECPDDEVAARAAILSAVADGNLTPGEAVEISQLIEALAGKLRKAEWASGRSGMTLKRVAGHAEGPARP
jgi:tellurite resistance protein